MPDNLTTMTDRKRLAQIEKLACLLDERVTMQGKARMLVAEEIVSAVERRVRKELGTNP